MEEPVGDENLTSTKLKEQLDKIKEKAHQTNEQVQVVDEAIETEVKLPCSVEENDPENAGTTFWRLMAECFATRIDELRKSKVELENSINVAKTTLADLEEVSKKLLKRADELDGDSGNSDGEGSLTD